MSYASGARAEIARLAPEKPCCARAEAAGMLRSGGSVTLLGGGGLAFALQSEESAVIHRAFSLFSRGFGAKGELLSHRRGSRQSYLMRLRGEEAAAILGRVGLSALGLEQEVPAEFCQAPCCARAFVRGAFLVCGTAADPDKGYHLEWRFLREGTAQAVRDMLDREGIAGKIAQRRESAVLYIKEADAIRDALALMGAVSALLELENVRVVKELRNLVNRQVNCEGANVDKAMEAAYRQIEAIGYLEAKGMLGRLSPVLIEAAELRLENPEATLEELGELFKKPVGKSAVNHRLRKLRAIAQEEREKEEGL